MLVDHVVAQSLATLPRTYDTLRSVIPRLALSNDTLSSQAVTQALLALSSLHRHGFQEEAARYQAAALAALRKSSNTTFGSNEAIQHVAAGMLLCSFEVHIPTIWMDDR